MRKCKNCGSKFSPDDGFLRRRFKKEHIVEAKRRTLSGAIHVFKKIRNGCKGIPEKIITDKLGHYRRAYNMFFYRLRGSCKLVHGVPIGCKNMGWNTTIIVLNGIMNVLSRDIKPQEDSRIQNRQISRECNQF